MLLRYHLLISGVADCMAVAEKIAECSLCNKHILVTMLELVYTNFFGCRPHSFEN